MFIEGKTCKELMERRYEICKAASTVSAAHKPHFLHVFKWYSQETVTVQCALSPLPGHFLKGKTTWHHTSRIAVSWLVLKGWIWHKKGWGWVKVSGQPSNSRYSHAHCPKFTVQQLGKVLCLHSSSYSACNIGDSQIVITYILAPNCDT